MCDARRPQEEDGNLRAALKAVITSLPREESPLPGRQAKEAAGGLRGEKQGPPNHGTLFPEHCFPGFPRESDSDRWMPQEGEKGLLPSLLGALIPAHALPLASAVQEETRRPWRGSRVWGTERPVTGMVSGLHALVQLELISQRPYVRGQRDNDQGKAMLNSACALRGYEPFTHNATKFQGASDCRVFKLGSFKVEARFHPAAGRLPLLP